MNKLLEFEKLPEVNSKRWLSLENLEGEEWRPIVDEDDERMPDGYMISNYGRVKRLECQVPVYYKNEIRYRHSKEYIKRLNVNKGYYFTSFRNNKSNCRDRFNKRTSRLVAKAFIPNPDNLPMVDHISTNTKDNRVCNLRWVTAKGNMSNENTIAKLKNKAKNNKTNTAIYTNREIYENPSTEDIFDNFETNSPRFLDNTDFKNETWKDIYIYNKHISVSNFGRVRSYIIHKNGFIYKQKKNINGYYTISLRDEQGKSHVLLIHRLVLSAFEGCPNENLLVDHIDTNPQNNKLENLRWVTHRENTNNELSLQKMREAALKQDHYSHKIAQYDASTGQFLNLYESVSETLKFLNVGETSLRSACCHNTYSNGYLWKYIDDENDIPQFIDPYEIPRIIPVNQYDKEGNFIRTFNSITDVERELGLNRSNIVQCCKRTYGFKSVGGYQWRYSDDCDDISKFSIKENIFENFVNMYDLNGKFIKQFRNIKTAKRETGCSSITQCCSEKYKKYTQSGGYQWRYAKDINDTADIEPLDKIGNANKLVNQYDLNGNFIKQFESVASAEKETGCSYIGKICNKPEKFKQYKGKQYRFAESGDDKNNISPYKKITRNQYSK